MNVADRKAAAAVEESVELVAEYSSLVPARRFADSVAARAGLSSEGRYAVTMACSEAVANAIEHGSRRGDRVRIDAAVEGDSLVLQVRDGGRFVPRVRPRGEVAERGRGLEFMSELMDEVQVRPGKLGTVVRLTKRLRRR